MNKNAVRIGLRATFFDTPHGLMNYISRSTAYDMAKLSAICLEDPRFEKIVCTKDFKVPRTKKNGNKKTYFWESTHKMLGQKGVIPVKTGVTNSAGPCLATCLELEKGTQLVVVLLGCKDMDCRWMETFKLAKWATNRLQKIKHF